MLRLTSRGFEMASSIITLAQIDLILLATLQWLIERKRSTHETLQDLTKTIQSRLQFEVMVGGALGDCGYDCNVVAFGANSMS